MAEGRATPKEIMTFFNEGTPENMKVKLTDLTGLKREPSRVAGHETAYDDIAVGIGNGSLTY